MFYKKIFLLRIILGSLVLALLLPGTFMRQASLDDTCTPIVVEKGDFVDSPWVSDDGTTKDGKGITITATSFTLISPTGMSTTEFTSTRAKYMFFGTDNNLLILLMTRDRGPDVRIGDFTDSTPVVRMVSAATGKEGDPDPVIQFSKGRGSVFFLFKQTQDTTFTGGKKISGSGIFRSTNGTLICSGPTDGAGPDTIGKLSATIADPPTVNILDKAGAKISGCTLPSSKCSITAVSSSPFPDAIIGGSPGEASQTNVYKITNIGSDCLDVESIAPDGPFAEDPGNKKTPLKIPPGKSADVTIRFTPSGVGSSTGELKIIPTTDASCAIRVTATAVRATALMAVSPTGFSICQVGKMTTFTRDFKVTSTGNQPIMVSVTPPSDVSIDGSKTRTLSKGESTTFTATFKSGTSTGGFDRTIQVDASSFVPSLPVTPAHVDVILTTNVVNPPSLDILDKTDSIVTGTEITLFVNPLDPTFPAGKPLDFKLKGNGSSSFNHKITDVRLFDPDTDTDFPDPGGFDVLPDPIRQTTPTLVTEMTLFPLQVIPNVKFDRQGFPIFPHKRVKVFFEAEICSGPGFIPIKERAFVIVKVVEIFPPTNVPTLSQWGLFIMSLLLMTVGTIFIARHQFILAGVAIGDVPQLNTKLLQHLFVLRVFCKSLAGTLVLAAIGLSTATLLSGSPSTTDISGTVVCAVLLAYLIHLLILIAGNSRKNAP